MSKQETLEEAAENFSKNHSIYDTAQDDTEYGFIAGAKWQRKQMYSEEDMQDYAELCINLYQNNLPCIVPKDWFNQFKKK